MLAVGVEAWHNKHMTNDKIAVFDEDVDLALEIVEWLRQQPLDGENSFLANLAAIAAVGYVNSATANMAAAALPAYQRAQRERLTVPSTRHAGAVGDKVDAIVTITGATMKRGAYGDYALINMVTDDGAAMVSFATGQDAKALAANPHAVGARRRVFGKVKETGYFKGAPSTTISHLVIQPEDFVPVEAKPRKPAKPKAAKAVTP